MDQAKILYIICLGFSSLVAFLFLRLLYWGFKSKILYWSMRKNVDVNTLKNMAIEKSMSLPFFSVMVPARDESDVIANTIEHLASIDYPKDLYEIVIITDAKELKNKDGLVTTQDMVEEKIREFKGRNNVPFLKHVVVPVDYDGSIKGRCIGEEVPSTKPRALNYAMNFISKQTDICGFYDAESRPENIVLKYLASRWIVTGGKQKVWQGSVFQVRNFYKLGCFTQIMSLYQAVSHDWHLPMLLERLPFLGGTNLFIEKNLLLSVDGFDPKALSEDLELGVHTYLESDEWPEFLPCVSTEQTPAKYKHYFRQRLRWGSGHLQVYDKLIGSTQYEPKKKKSLLRTLFWRGHFMWYFYQLMVLMPLVFFVLASQGMIDSTVVHQSQLLFFFNVFLQIFCPIYYLFTMYLFWRYSKYIDFSGITGYKKYLPVLNLVLLPVLGFFIALPYSTALVMRALRCQPKVWVKTPRTQEIRIKAS